MKKKTLKQSLSMIVVLTLLLGILPVNAWAVDHVHDESCGYSPPTDCNHTVCSTEVCGYVAEVTGNPCAHETGTHEGCGYVAEVPGTPCAHALGNHDTACGYHAGSACSMAGWTCDHATCGYAPAVICEVQDCTHESCDQTGGTPCPNANWTCSHEECGYVEAVACGHGENHNADCGYSAGTPGTPCGHTTHDSTCGYVEAVTGTACGHSHDDACGYSEGSVCNYAVAPIDDTEHTCTYGDYTYDTDGHWQVCTDTTCNTETQKENHVYDDDTDTTCDTCGYTRTVVPVVHEMTATLTGETSVTMQKGVTFFGGYYVLTPLEGVTFTNIDWSVSGDLPAGITLGVNRAGGDGSARAFLEGTPTAMTSGAMSVTINVEATDGTNTYTGSLAVSITVEDSPAHMLLDELIQGTVCEVPMTTANTAEAVVAWVQNTWLPSLDGYSELVAQLGNGYSITVEDASIPDEGIGGFTAAVAGTEADPDGTDGSLLVRFRLDEYYNYLDNGKECIIKATEYAEHTHAWGWQYTSDVHWQECSDPNCDERSAATEEHMYDNDSDLTCDVCGYVRTVEGKLYITGSMPDATVGEAYSASFSHTGTVSGMVFWNATGLPDGLTIDYGTGTISGTPTTAGKYKVTVSMGATGGGSAAKDFTLIVNESEHTHSYTVTFYPNGGTGSMQRQTFAAGETKALTPNAFTRPGYIFMGWNTQENGGGTSYSDEARITLDSNLTLYAQWMELTITASHTALAGNGNIALTTSIPVNKITCSESKYEKYISGGGRNWTFQMKNNVTTDLTFTITYMGETASCTVSFEQDPNALILTPSRTSLFGNGVITLTGNKDIASISCSNQFYEDYISGSGQNWQFVMDRNVDVYLYFEATAATGETALCWITFNQYTPPSSSDDDDDYTPPIPADTEQNENGDTVTTAEPSTVVKKDTATSTITVADGNRLVNEVVRNGSDQLVIAPKIGQDVSGVEVSIPATVVKQLAERTDADLQITTGVAEVNIGSAELDGHSGSLVMEAQRTEDGISTKVTIGGVTVIDTGVKLPEGVDLPEDGKLVVGTLQPGVNDLNFLLPPETIEPPNVTQEVNVEAADIQNHFASTFTGPGEVEYTRGELLLIDGKEYYLYPGSGSGKLQLLDMEGILYDFDGTNPPESTGTKRADFPEKDEYISVNGAVYQVLYSEQNTVVLYMDGKIVGEYLNYGALFLYGDDYHPDKVNERQQLSGTVTTGETPIDGLESGKTYNVSVIGSNDIHLEGAENVGGTVTQTFEVPAEFVGNENVKYVAVHDPNPYAKALAEAEATRFTSSHNEMEYIKLKALYDSWAEANKGIEYGTVTVSEDGKTLIASYAVDSFSPFIVYAFVEADEPEIKTLSATVEIPDESAPQAPAPAVEDALGHPIFLWITIMSLAAITLLAVVIVAAKRKRR